MVDGIVTLVLNACLGTMGYCLHPPVLSVVVDGTVSFVCIQVCHAVDSGVVVSTDDNRVIATHFEVRQVLWKADSHPHDVLSDRNLSGQCLPVCPPVELSPPPPSLTLQGSCLISGRCKGRRHRGPVGGFVLVTDGGDAARPTPPLT